MDETSSSSAESDVNWDQALRLFSNVITSASEGLQLRALLKLANLSKHAPTSILASTIPILADLLRRSSNPSIQEAAAYALLGLARSADGRLCPAIGDSGALQTLLTLLSDPETQFRKTLLRCVYALVCFDGSNRTAVARNGGLEIILGLFPSSADRGRRYLLEILSALAMLREARRAMANLGGLPLLVEAVSTTRMISRTRAAQAVGLLGIARRIRRVLVAAGAVPALVGLLREGDASAKLVAGNALGVISSHVDSLRLVAHAGAIPLYAELLEGPDPLGREIAEDVFCVLAVAEENAVLISQHLARILRGDDDEAKAAAIDVVWDLSVYNHSVSVMRVSGVIPLLLKILQDGGDDIREKASGALAQMSYDEESRRAMAEVGAIRVLIDLLRADSEDIKEFAVEALMNFAEDVLFREEVSEIYDSPLFQAIQERWTNSHASDEHMLRSMRLLSVEQFTSNPELF